ncbi:MAG: hypothetical protein IM526_02510 [Microcystis sp. M38BS1]|uniref:thymidylate synthase n=1 Tax=Microcystis sp. M38BS1 TaxID=2771188 RepID=UPI0031FC4D93|nr:hypothetical protein [Microcystis sp. M38BS1]MCA6582531.1 hypothetical protein [Pseudanabaena sp. M34BS1SP1A06MG]
MTTNYTSADITYAFLLQNILRLNNVVETRNHSCYCNPFLDNVIFDSLPLITVRKTAWKLALTEMEWFMSGSLKCPEKLSKWWAGQLNKDGNYINGYAEQFRNQTTTTYGRDEHGMNEYNLDGFDQIAYILDGLKNHQHSRRLVLTSWNTGEMANITKTNNNPNTPSTCFPSWSTVLTKEGIRTISDLSVGEFIWDGSKYVEVLAITPKGIQDVYCATTRKGNFYSTLDHKVSNGQKLVALKDAKRLEICTGAKSSTINLDPQDIMNGLCLADGTIHHNKIFLHIGQNDYDYFDSEISHLIYNNIHSNTDPTVYNVETTLTSLPKTFDRNIPDEYLYANAYKKAGLLRGIFSGNGSYSEMLTLHQTSEVFINQVQLMLNSLGISSSVRKCVGRETEFKNGTYKCKDSYILTILRQDHDLFFSCIGFIQKYKAQKSTTFSKNTTTALIKDLSLHSTEEVFDITVDSEEHLLWCNGFRVSNCHASLVQFFVVNGELHIKHYARSQDMLLGFQANIVQYWALLTYFAFHANLKVGSLTWVFGDAHIYNEESHIEAAKQIIEFGNDIIKYKPIGSCNNNSPMNPPLKLVYNYSGELDSFGTPKFNAADFTIEGEIPKPTVLTKPKLL